MKEKLVLQETFNVDAKLLYKSWLSSKEHTEMTGATAKCSSNIGGKFTAWDGYISGANLELKENEKIVQTWRTTEFEEEDEDSILTISFEKAENATTLILNHTNIPEGQTQYLKGWQDFYFKPMKEYFK